MSGSGISVDGAYYMQQNPEVAASGMSAADHYAQYGQKEGRAPNAAVATVQNTIANPTLPSGTTVTPSLINPGVDIQGYQQVATGQPFDAAAYLKANPDVAASGMDPYQHYVQFGQKEGRAANNLAQNAAQATAGQVNPANYTKPTAPTYDATTIGNNTPEVQAAQGTVDPRSLVTAEQEQVDKENSTVQGQLKQLMEGDLSFANGAMRKANEAMAARGLGSSTMAGEAITNAVMESALPIAQADAAIFGQFQLQNLNNRQQAALQNAQTYNQVNLANLSNEQQARLANQTARVQTLLSDQAAQNASKQFNATSQAQTDQFFANLQAQIDQFNAAQATAVSQFNTGETNAFNKFQTEMLNQREQFNTTMRAQIDQSNYQWRRSVNTANTAAVNAAQQLNAQNSLNLSNWALNAVWQQFRDEADQAFTASESAANRAYGLAYAAIQNEYNVDATEAANQQKMYESLGSWAAATISDMMK